MPSSVVIGREGDIARVIDLLARSRLVTVVGPGGVGKTQVALEVARRLAPSFADGAAFVSLADLDDAALVASELARGLDLVDVSSREPEGGLNAALGSLRMLLVVDNFEHLVESAPVLAEISTGCPELTLLVTSRRRLGLSGEQTFELAPLAVPPKEGPPKDPAQTASVALFCERAAAVDSRFRPDRSALEAVGELCRLVDGLPLAIELVASHVRLLPAEALLAQMRGAPHALQLLGGGPVDAVARHRDLRHTIGWSVNLLSAAAARLLPRLSVFREGWTLGAMEGVCCSDLAPADAFEALVELVDLHLAEPARAAGGEARFRLLETVRRFAADELTNDAVASEVLDRHADHFAELARRAGAGLQGTDEHRWAAQIDQELPNVRAAMQHLAATGRVHDALATAAALGPYWLDHGPMREGQDWIDRFLPAAPGSRRGGAIAEGWSARLALEQGDVYAFGGGDAGETRLRRAREALDCTDDVIEWLRITEHLSRSLHLQGRFAEADGLLVEAVEQCRTSETTWLRAELLLTRAVNAQDSGDRAREHVVTLFEDAIRAAKLARHDRVRAQAVGRMMLTVLRDPPVIDPRVEIEQAFHLSLGLGDRRNAARSAVVAAVLALIDRDRTAAATWFGRSLDISVAIGFWPGVAWAVAGITGLAARAGLFVDAARLHGAMRPHLDHLRKETPDAQIAAYQHLVESLRDQLGDDFERECQAGEERAWTVTVSEARRIAADLSGDAAPMRPSRRRRGPRANPQLTERELDVLCELVAGHTNHEIASALAIRPKTVMHHTVSIYRKLAVRGRAEAVAHALRTGLVSV